jgi:hypothetical protein
LPGLRRELDADPEGARARARLLRGCLPDAHSWAELDAIRDAIYELVADEQPMTVRQVFYRLVSEGLIAKTEAEYKGTVGRLLTEMRLDGVLPLNWIADNTRWMRKPRTFDGKKDALLAAAKAYRRDVWTHVDAYVEVWLEKEALAGVIYDVTEEWDVRLMVTRGYPSLSFLHSSAATIAKADCPVYLYYLGDHDPSGVDISRTVEERLCEFAPDADIWFERFAVTEEQIEGWDLPTRPTKRTDTRSKGWQGGSVEVDAIRPDLLRWLVQNRIEIHIDEDELESLRRVEAEERKILLRLAVNGRHA